MIGKLKRQGTLKFPQALRLGLLAGRALERSDNTVIMCWEIASP
ncbi:hypothetical protein GCWU000325_00272 [Alloprevotella tannerae ATCC 51259]|uniref:Uncharacterized protein n=1 Tax=Alloprevotella tannerae ATCC 51259 TaxID=626522 RepID=C9LDK1_9BACT|nr:hypothetical protein GCWU000325_00272 [Alloprevotella tannerae ATCC 51259]